MFGLILYLEGILRLKNLGAHLGTFILGWNTLYKHSDMKHKSSSTVAKNEHYKSLSILQNERDLGGLFSGGLIRNLA